MDQLIIFELRGDSPELPSYLCPLSLWSRILIRPKRAAILPTDTEVLKRQELL